MQAITLYNQVSHHDIKTVNLENDRVCAHSTHAKLFVRMACGSHMQSRSRYHGSVEQRLSGRVRSWSQKSVWHGLVYELHLVVLFATICQSDYTRLETRSKAPPLPRALDSADPSVVRTADSGTAA